jgi:uncharacterized repeat protein (TIGR01451 family)
MKSKLFRIFVLIIFLSTFMTPATGQVIAESRDPQDLESHPVPQNVITSSADLEARSIEVSETGFYIIRLKDPALASYDGGIPGLVATSPMITGAEKLDVSAPTSQTYLSYLDGKQAEAVNAIEQAIGRKVEVQFQYMNVLNGMALTLDPEEVEQVASLPEVLAVYPDRLMELDTDVTPEFIGAVTIWEGGFTTYSFFSHLSGANEVPPNASSASGIGAYTYDPTSRELSWIISHDLNLGDLTGAHIHVGAAGVNGPVIIPLDHTQNPMVGSVTLTEEQQGWLMNHLLYVNVHTSTFPGGEIRDQLYTDGYRGEGVIIGVLDTGINSQHPSFAEVDGHGYIHINPYGSGSFVGVCDPGDPNFESDFCNDKLIGAYNFHPSAPSAEDWNGHGSHTAGTSGGNIHNAVFSVSADVYTRTIAGIAPRANIISYLVCFPSCPQSSSVAAVNQAISDGVDVLNFSISGTDNPWNDIVDLAFLDAYGAGMFISASAGNAGPGASTVAKTGPWNAAVAATTINRIIANTLDVTGPTTPPELQDIAAVQGSGPALLSDLEAPIKYDPTNNTGCTAFSSGFFSGSLALIQRGECTFETKVNNASDAGAVGVVVFNNVGGPPIVMGALDATTIPSVMTDLEDGIALRDFIQANPSAEARINTSTSLVFNDDWEDITAGFSSRGPSQSELIKPDYAAPGVNILAASSVMDEDPVQYEFMQGTSMASPHGAGAAALIAGLHPGWSPAEVKSALASSAFYTDRLMKEDGFTPADPFDVGSGRIDLTMASRVGLVFDETHANFIAANPDMGGDPKTLNLPSMASRSCPDECSWTRTVKSVVGAPISYTVSIEAPAGVSLNVSPSSFTINPGATQELQISIDVSTQPIDSWVFAHIYLETTDVFPGSDPAVPVTNVHMPVAVIPTEDVAVLDLNPTSLSETLTPGETSVQTLSIGNIGGIPLVWDLVELEPTGSFILSSTIWDQPVSGNSGIVSDYFNMLDGGVYSADDFTLPIDAQIEYIFAEGFFNTGSLADATAIDWFIYPDDNGMPAGHPEDGLDLHIWTHSTLPTGAGVDITNQNIGLDVVAATGSTIDLSAGKYWLSVFPSIDAPTIGGATRWNWHQGTPRGSQAHLADPNDLFGLGATNWTPFLSIVTFSDLAFRLEGTMACTPGDIPWLSLSPTSGTVEPGSEDLVDVTFDSTGLSNGEYDGNLCLMTNDPANEVVLIPVSLTIEALPVIHTSPDSFTFTVPFMGQDEDDLTITNLGGANLVWSIEEENIINSLNSITLYDQTGNTSTSGALAIYDLDGPEVWSVQAADDFVVPLYETWYIEQIYAQGFYLGLVNNPTEINVFFYQDDDGLPGEEILAAQDLPATTDVDGLLTLTLPEPLMLTSGHYWVSVQPKMDFFVDGRWYWFMETVQSFNPFAWRNPGNGYGTGCTDWGVGMECAFGLPDLSFALSGEREADCDTLDDIPWLSLSPTSGITPPGMTDLITVSVDTTSLTPGATYQGNLCVFSNDPAMPLVVTPVTMHVGDLDGFYDVLLHPAAAAQTAAPGDTVNYTIQLTNTGSLASSFSFEAVNPDFDDVEWSYTVPSDVNLDPGQSTSVSVSVHVPAGAAPSERDYVAIVVSADGPLPGDRLVMLVTDVRPDALLRVDVTTDPDPIVVNQETTFHVVVSNLSPGTATGVVLQDVLPTQMSFVSASDECTYNTTTRVITCNLGSIPSGGSKSVEVVLIVHSWGIDLDGTLRIWSNEIPVVEIKQVITANPIKIFVPMLLVK